MRFLYCLILLLLRATFSDNDKCSMFDKEILGEIFEAKDNSLEYLEACKQWAYPSYKTQRIHPSIIIYPKCDNDIFITLEFARLCEYKVVIRSGGHQYDALSSCNSEIYKCIQIDLQYYNEKQIYSKNKTLQVGPGVRLGELNVYLDENNYFLPSGQHPGIGIGGHILTGGNGYLTKSHGLIADYVISFDIITSDGNKIKNVKYDDDSTKELYWAVLGGGPGAYGIVTKYEMDLSKTNNNNYKQSIAFYYKFMYSKELMFVFGDLFIKIHDDKENYLENENIGSFSLALSYDFELNDYVIKIAWIWTGKEENSQSDKNYLSQLFLNEAKKISIVPINEEKIESPISKLMLSLSEDYGDISPLPYMIREHDTNINLNDEFIDLLIDRIELIYKKYGKYDSSGMCLGIILLSCGGIKGATYINDESMTKTSYPFRSRLIAFPIILFYNKDIHKESERMSEKWLDDTIEILMLTKPYNYGQDDYRDISVTFGDIDINNVWKYYYHDQTAFHKLQEIKLKYDPIDLFHTSFTTPLPTDKDNNRNKRDL